MINVLTIMNDELAQMNIPYTFDTWDKDIALPQFIGEISEVRTLDEDGKNEYSFILTGYATSYSYLFQVAENIKKRYKTSDIVKGVVIKYDNLITVDNGSDDLKQIQITLTIKEWSV